MLFLIEAAHALLDRLGPELDVEGVRGNLSRDTRHVHWSPCQNIFVAPKEGHELAFLFGILGSLEGARPGGHGRVGRRGLHVDV
jgi:hypothetical protein